MPKLLTTKEAAPILRVKATKTLERWRLQTGKPPWIGEGKGIRYRDDLCKRWLNGARDFIDHQPNGFPMRDEAQDDYEQWAANYSVDDEK